MVPESILHISVTGYVKVKRRTRSSSRQPSILSTASDVIVQVRPLSNFRSCLGASDQKHNVMPTLLNLAKQLSGLEEPTFDVHFFNQQVTR